MDSHADPRVGDRVKLTGTRSKRNTGIVVAIKNPGSTKTRVIVRPDHPTPPIEHEQEPSMMRPPAPDVTNDDDLWDCGMLELEVVEPGAESTDDVMAFESGQRVMYDGNADDIWIVVNHEPDAKYAYCARGLTRDKGGRMVGTGKTKNIVAAMLTPAVDVKKARRPAAGGPVVRKEKKRKDNIGDAVSDILAEAQDLDQLWKIAELAGMDVPSIRAKIGGLNPGLQRMGIGNRLRHLQRKGTLTITLEDVMERLNGE